MKHKGKLQMQLKTYDDKAKADAKAAAAEANSTGDNAKEGQAEAGPPESAAAEKKDEEVAAMPEVYEWGCPGEGSRRHFIEMCDLSKTPAEYQKTLGPKRFFRDFDVVEGDPGRMSSCQFASTVGSSLWCEEVSPLVVT